MPTSLLITLFASFVCIGFPASALGAAWPAISADIGVSITSAGTVTMIMSIFRVITVLLTDRLSRKFRMGSLITCAVTVLAVSMFGFATAKSMIALCLWAVPNGLASGLIDTGINDYVSLHGKSSHMSWLHCMWGLGSASAPYLISLALNTGNSWHLGYLILAAINCAVTAALFVSLPKWVHESQSTVQQKPLSIAEMLRMPGVIPTLICFFCHDSLESSISLWASSYMAEYHGLSADAAAIYSSIFFVGVTAGRALSGFAAMKFNDKQLIRTGLCTAVAGAIFLFLPIGVTGSAIGFVLLGLGLAPVIPCLLHATPARFGASCAQSLIGIQMGVAFVGSTLMPPLFGQLSNFLSMGALPYYLLVLLAVALTLHEVAVRKASAN